MFTARAQKNLKDAKEYFRQHLSQGDYYSQGHSVAGQWFCKGAARLGLDAKSPVKAEQFERLCENQYPLTGQQLTARRRVANHRIYYDFTASASKSVSIMAYTVGDRRIIAEHEAAARESMLEMEKFAATRVRLGGQQGDRRTGELVVCVFSHDASRALDPQLHTHFIVFNATWDDVEKRWKALETREMFDNINFFTEIYRNKMAARLRQLGYSLRKTANGFEIDGVPEEIIHRFSKRRRTILESEKELLAAINHKLRSKLEQAVRESAGKSSEERERAERALREFHPVTKVSNTARSTIAHQTREWKDTSLSAEDIVAHQRSQLSEEELGRLRKLVPREGAPPVKHPEVTTPKQAIDYARDHLFERSSVVHQNILLGEALKFSFGRLELDRLKEELVRHDEFIAVGEMLTTQETLDEEKRMIQLVNTGIGTARPLNPGYRCASRHTKEERQTVEFILKSFDRVVALHGVAGSGKTRLLQEVIKGVLEKRHPLAVLAPTTGGVEALRDSGYRGAATVQRFLVDLEFQKNAAGGVVIVDEGGLVCRKDMLALLEFAAKTGTKLVLCGDTGQHMSVQAGDALRILEKNSALATVSVSKVIRQKNREYQEAINELANGKPMEGLARLDRLGAIEELADDIRLSRLAEDYSQSMNAGRSTLAVCPTWNEIHQVTKAIREKLQTESLLGRNEVQMNALDSLNWTKAQKREFRNYRPGLMLQFKRNTTRFQRGDAVPVTRVEQDSVTVRNASGVEEKLTAKQSDCYDVMENVVLGVARKERLLLQGSVKSIKLFKGQIVTVDKVNPNGSISLTDGRRIPATFRNFTHGYCMTSVSAQGRTLEDVYVSMNRSTVMASSLNQFYVSVSRGTKRLKIFTDDIEHLRLAVRRSGARLSATELLESQKTSNRAAQEQTQAVDAVIRI